MNQGKIVKLVKKLGFKENKNSDCAMCREFYLDGEIIKYELKICGLRMKFDNVRIWNTGCNFDYKKHFVATVDHSFFEDIALHQVYYNNEKRLQGLEYKPKQKKEVLEACEIIEFLKEGKYELDE